MANRPIYVTSTNGTYDGLKEFADGANSGIKIPSGSKANRNSSPSTGEIRYNTDNNYLEYYDGSAWVELAPDATETLTNKTIDANGTGNSISNLEVADLASGVLDTDLATVSSNDDTLASAKAAKAYIDANAVTLDSTQTLTNKTLDIDSNTLSNLEVDNFKGTAIVLSSEGLASSDNDTSIPTTAAVTAYFSASSGLSMTSGTLALDINGATDGTSITVDGDNDLVLLYDASATQVVKVKTSQIASPASLNTSALFFGLNG